MTSPALLAALSLMAPCFCVTSINRLPALLNSGSVPPNDTLKGPPRPPFLNERLCLLEYVTCISQDAKEAQYRAQCTSFTKANGTQGKVGPNKVFKKKKGGLVAIQVEEWSKGTCYTFFSAPCCDVSCCSE